MNEVIIWIKDIFIVILSITFIEILMPEGTMANYLKFIFSIIVLAVILSPVSSFPGIKDRRREYFKIDIKRALCLGKFSLQKIRL